MTTLAAYPPRLGGEMRSAPHLQLAKLSLPVDDRVAPFVRKMRQAELPEAAIRMFQYYYEQLTGKADGYLPEAQALPVNNLPHADGLAGYRSAGLAALPATIQIKLNGGLGTTMGMQGPKSLLPVKAGLSFLDIIARQTLHLRKQHGVNLPLLLMNSFSTEKQSMAALKAHPGLRQNLPASIEQHKIPKIWQERLTPAEWPSDRSKEWCPPGHGDLYLALQTSGLLARLLSEGYEYAFISNADNLGATLDLSLLGYMAEARLPFLMEVARRQRSDCKGGHLANHPEHGLILREIAQCPADELESFQDIERYCYFNTNNLWLHLPSLQGLLAEHNGLLPLPLIRNEKPIDPTQPASPRVYQLETAVGHALSLFPDAGAVEVARERFLPVKTTNDLLALWSDAYVLNRNGTISRNPQRADNSELVVDLDPAFYGHFHQLKARFPHHLPSLVDCRQFRVRGNLYFDTELRLAGDVTLEHPGPAPVRWAAIPISAHDGVEFS